MIWVVMAKTSPNQPYHELWPLIKQTKEILGQIKIIFSCKKLTYTKFSEDYVDLVENIINLITVALWEICCRMFSFVQITEVEVH